MSYTRLLSLFLICFSLLLGSCSKEDSTSPSDTNNQNTNTSITSLSAKVDGVSLNFENINADELPHLNRIVIIALNMKEGVAIGNLSLTIDKDIKPGTYTLNGYTSNTISYTNPEDTWMISFFGGNKGTLIITKSTAEEIEGTFSASLISLDDNASKKEITEGKFHLKLKDVY